VTTARGVVRNTFAVLGQLGLSHALRLVSTILLLAALSRSDYGLLTAAFAFVDPVRTLAALGLDTAALRRAGREPDRLPEILGTLLSLRVKLGAAAFVLCLPLALVRGGPPGSGLAVMAAALSILPAVVSGPLSVAFQARHRVHRILLLPALASAVYVGAVLALWAARAPVGAFVAAAAAGEAVAALALRAAARREVREPLRSDAGLARDLVREGLPLAAVNLAVIVYGRLGIWLLEVDGGLGPVADYGAARRLSEPIVLAGSALAVSLNPYLSRLFAEGRGAEARLFLAKALLLSLLVLAPLAAAAGFVAEPAARALQPEYAGAVAAFRWLLAGSVAMFAAQVLSSSLVAAGRFRLLAALAFANLAVFVALAVPLVRARGAEGAAMATTGMESLNALVQAVLVFLARRPPVRGLPGTRSPAA
jgi:O-antigen/teichoic acid export membrane protein